MQVQIRVELENDEVVTIQRQLPTNFLFLGIDEVKNIIDYELQNAYSPWKRCELNLIKGE